MNTLEKANQVRREKALNKLYHFQDYGIKSQKQLIDEGIYTKSKITFEPELKYNRRKFNSLSGEEQETYYKRATENTKEVYNLVEKKLFKGKYESLQEVSVYVYDYFNEKQNAENCIECKKPMTDTETNYGTPDFFVCIHCDNDAKQVQKMLNF